MHLAPRERQSASLLHGIEVLVVLVLVFAFEELIELGIVDVLLVHRFDDG